LCESGEKWVELKAVHMSGRALVVVDRPDLERRVNEEFERRYTALRSKVSALPKEAREHYRGFSLIEVTPDPRVLSWDNARLRVDE
jgi:hypothetical protein